MAVDGIYNSGQPTSLWVAVYGVLLKECRALLRHPGQWCYPLSFFIWVVALFPLSIGTDALLLQAMATGSIWIAALLASYLSYHRLFLQDFSSGVLHQMVFSEIPMVVQVQARIVAHWLYNGVPLVVLSPLLCLWMGLEGAAVGWLMLGLLLGTLAIYTINALMAALTLHANASGALVMLIAMPLQVPIIILGTGITSLAAAGYDIAGSLALLASLTCFMICTLPFMIGAVIKMMLSA